jgi:hypothetical protein
VRSGDAARSVSALLDSDKAAMATVAQAVAMARWSLVFQVTVKIDTVVAVRPKAALMPAAVAPKATWAGLT